MESRAEVRRAVRDGSITVEEVRRAMVTPHLRGPSRQIAREFSEARRHADEVNERHLTATGEERTGLETTQRGITEGPLSREAPEPEDEVIELSADTPNLDAIRSDWERNGWTVRVG